MAEVPDEIKDLQSNVALNMLSDLLRQGKITQDQCDAYKKKFQKLHDTIVQTFQNHKVLWSKAKKLKNDLTNEKQSLEQAINKQAEAQEKAQQLNANLKKAEGEYEQYERKIDVLSFEHDDLEQEKMNKLMKIQEEEKEARNKIAPELERLNAEIESLKDDFQRRKNLIESDQKNLHDQSERIALLKKDNDEQLNEISRLHDETLKIKDDPVRFAKNADMLHSANTVMLADLQVLLDDIVKKDKSLLEQNGEINHLNTKLVEYEVQIDTEKKEIEKHNYQIKRFSDEYNKLREEYNGLQGDKYKNETELRTSQKEIRRHNDIINSLKKLIEQDKKVFRSEQHQKNRLRDQIFESKMGLDKYNKEEQDYKYEMEKQEDVRINVNEENILLEGKQKQVSEKTSEKGNEKQLIQKQIDELEKQLVKLQEFEGEAQKKVKALTAMRESMARKASSALAEVRETREELKIKELLILDLTKKYQETEFKLNSFKALYEEVKSARNKYVNLIQNSSQDLAELKERIKILQNELEILKNESQEKERTLMEYKHILQLEIHKRDRTHAKLNKLEYSRKSKKEIVDQNINEIEKLNMIIMSLEKDMLNLRKQYEQVCESRNYTGIQLIDRNDELCILYEKANIQENILRSGELEIKILEDEIRMIKIEISEQKRKIDVARKQIVVVPSLADKVLQLKNQLDLEKRRELSLAEELENPENLQRWRELKGEDPDQEALDAKIHVLEERLNNKKEQLLEKELILDEITNLSEKLRKQALEGRLTTLELSEKVNEFQAKLKDLTRKMMATISELSMFQATAIKLQQEREESDKVVDEARERVEQSLPPTPETEIEYLKMIRDQKRHEEERSFRMQREAIEKNFPPFATKTRAEHRVNAYIPDDGSGVPLPKSYGIKAPFKPQEPGANMRHFRKPKYKEIEI